MHNAAFAALGIDAVYCPLRCAAADLASLLRVLANAGGGNVTVPHKAAAAAAVDRLDDTATATGAINTFWTADGEIVGGNTDVAGVLAAVEALGSPAGPWLVIGTGGAARAVAVAAGLRGVGLAVRSRDGRRAAEFASWAADRGAPPASSSECGLVINATPLGLAEGDAMPLVPASMPQTAAALDLVYARGETPWVRAVRARGHRAADGREMLVAQGAAAFGRWFPALTPPVEIMRAVVYAALR